MKASDKYLIDCYGQDVFNAIIRINGIMGAYKRDGDREMFELVRRLRSYLCKDRINIPLSQELIKDPAGTINRVISIFKSQCPHGDISDFRMRRERAKEPISTSNLRFKVIARW